MEEKFAGVIVYYWDATWDQFSFDDIDSWTDKCPCGKEHLVFHSRGRRGRAIIPLSSVRKYTVHYAEV